MKYIDHRHAQRAYRQRVKERLEAAGMPTTLSLAAAEASNPTTGHNGDVRKSTPARVKRRTELRVSYRKAVEATVEAIEAARGWPKANAEDLARLLLKPKLTDRQRAALEQHNPTQRTAE